MKTEVIKSLIKETLAANPLISENDLLFELAEKGVSEAAHWVGVCTKFEVVTNGKETFVVYKYKEPLADKIEVKLNWRDLPKAAKTGSIFTRLWKWITNPEVGGTVDLNERFI
jgi:hypothetical protein